jgi:hypothetical protein
MPLRLNVRGTPRGAIPTPACKKHTLGTPGPQRARLRVGVDLGRRALSQACAAFFVSRNGLLAIVSCANKRAGSASGE